MGKGKGNGNPFDGKRVHELPRLNWGVNKPASTRPYSGRKGRHKGNTNPKKGAMKARQLIANLPGTFTGSNTWRHAPERVPLKQREVTGKREGRRRRKDYRKIKEVR